MSMTESATSSQYLSSSITSLTGSHYRIKKSNKLSSEVSKTYKYASQLYLTRRLVECYDTLQSIIKPVPHRKDEARSGHMSQSEDENNTQRALVATASTSYRIKTWVLYTTLLSAIIELGDEEGKSHFGAKRYREIVRCVQTGDIWEQVLVDGYAGRESAVDAEVVYNLSNLLLAHAPDQVLNQTRLETYLSTSLHGSLDFSTMIHNRVNNYSKHPSSGIDTSKDLNSRIKILELFVLHVLPANKEWDYARSFVQNSDILEEERREALLQTLVELQEAREQEERELRAEKEEDLVGFAEQTEEEEVNGDRIHMHEDESDACVNTNGFHNTRDGEARHGSPSRRNHLHRRTSSEIDYGIEDTPSTTEPTTRHASSTSQLPQPTPDSLPINDLGVVEQFPPTQSPSPAPTAPPPSTVSQPSSEPRSLQSARKSPKRQPSKSQAKLPPVSKGRIASILKIVRNLSNVLSQSLTRNPTVVFRTLMFLFAFLLVLAKKEVRERLKRIFERGWAKILATARMGGKISYI